MIYREKTKTSNSSIDILELSEDQEQIIVVKHLEELKLINKIVLFTAHADNMKTHIATATKAKRLGKRVGYPDLTIITTKNILLYIELKKEKKGVVSQPQKEWIEALNKCSGVKAFVCHGSKQAIETINQFI